MTAAQALAKPLSAQLLADEPLLRLSYSAPDGSPRVIPIAYVWDGTSICMWTTPISVKVRALRADPRVAMVIDTAGTPPRILLMRGVAELETVDGVPDGYLDASHRTMPRVAWNDFDAGVRALYDQMTAITVTPSWAKLIDFETNAPSAVEQLVREKQASQGDQQA